MVQEFIKILKIFFLFNIMNICINIFFNFLFILCGLIIFFSKKNIATSKNLICIISILYYTFDSINEIYLEKRLLYIPHHLISVFIFYELYYKI